MLLTEKDKEKIYTDYCVKVKRYISGKVHNPHDAEDLVSSVFLKAFEKLDTFDETKSSVSTWIFTITRNTVIDYYRTSKTFSEIPEDLSQDGEIDEGLINSEMLEALYRALKELDERERSLIIFHYYNGSTLKSIADDMNMSYANAKVIHKKALKSLQAALSENL